MATSDSKIDLSLLKEMPKLNRKLTLVIRPLAPLSMVSELPGSFYKTLKYPGKKMICGLFENLLGWHFDVKTREAIFKDMAKVRKNNKVEIKEEQYREGSTYLPLLMDYFDISDGPRLKDFRSMFNYSDYWSRGYRRDDAINHLMGSRHVDASLLPYLYAEWQNLSSSEKNKWRSYNMDKIPFFYTVPTRREYINLVAVFEIPLLLDAHLVNRLFHQINESNICYLGNSEGWIDVELK